MTELKVSINQRDIDLNNARLVLNSLKYMLSSEPGLTPHEQLTNITIASTIYIETQFNSEIEFYTCIAAIYGKNSNKFIKELYNSGRILSYSDVIINNTLLKLKQKYENKDVTSHYMCIFKFLNKHGVYSIYHYINIIEYVLLSSAINEDQDKKCSACLYLSGDFYKKGTISYTKDSIKDLATRISNIKNDVYNKILASPDSKKRFNETLKQLVYYKLFNKWVYIYQDTDSSFDTLKFESIDIDIDNFSKYDPVKCRTIRKLNKTKLLGKGGYGSVYEVDAPSIGPKKYALKTQFEYTDDQIKKENKENKNTYVLSNNVLLEFLIGRILGSSYENGECINFFNIYSYTMCESLPLYSASSRSRSISILMDKISGSFYKGATCIKAVDYLTIIKDNKLYTNISDNVFVQLLFAIAFYQDKWKISHNDLHYDNIFLEYINEDTVYKGQRLIDADYFHYRVKGQDIYMNASPVIVKIGDFGYSIKYSEPVLLSESFYEQRYDFDNKNNHKGELVYETIPLEYIPQYDTYFASTSYCNMIQTDFIYSIYTYLTGRTISNFLTDSPITRPYKDYKPVPEIDLKSLPTAIDLFANEKLLSNYNFLTKPKQGKIITLGIIN